MSISDESEPVDVCDIICAALDANPHLSVDEVLARLIELGHIPPIRQEPVWVGIDGGGVVDLGANNGR